MLKLPLISFTKGTYAYWLIIFVLLVTILMPSPTAPERDQNPNTKISSRPGDSESDASLLNAQTEVFALSDSDQNPTQPRGQPTQAEVHAETITTPTLSNVDPSPTFTHVQPENNPAFITPAPLVPIPTALPNTPEPVSVIPEKFASIQTVIRQAGSVVTLIWAKDTQAQAVLHQSLTTNGIEHSITTNFSALMLRVNNELLAWLIENEALIASANPDPLMYLIPQTTSSADAPSGFDYLTLIGTYDEYRRGYRGQGIIVASIDTAADLNHASLAGKILEAHTACFSKIDTSRNFSSTCPNNATRQFGEGAAGLDGCNHEHVQCLHGTTMAQIIGGNNGVAPDARLIPINVFSILHKPADCSGQPAPCIATFGSSILEAFDHLLSLPIQFRPAVVNLSVASGIYSGSCRSVSPEVALAVDKLLAAGILVTVAVGNNANSGGVSFPACLDNVLAVGATDQNDLIADFSNTGNALDVLAPGKNIRAAVPTSSAPDGYSVSSGTSLSSAIVAGCIALVKSQFPNASAADIINFLKTHGVPIALPRFISSRVNLDSNPIAVDDLAIFDEDSGILIDALMNDLDADDKATLALKSILAQPQHGTVTIINNALQYIPNLNYFGDDSFAYEVSDGYGPTATGSVFLHINPVNDPPVLTPISSGLLTLGVDEGSTASYGLTVTDVDGDVLSVSSSIGTILRQTDGSYLFTYTSSDGPAENQPVIIAADDEHGEKTLLNLNLVVNNLPPTAVFETIPGDNQTVMLNFRDMADPSAGDLASLTYSFDCNGDGYETVDSLTPAFPCSYSTEGIYTVSGQVRDKDGGVTAYSSQITVAAKTIPQPDLQVNMTPSALAVTVGDSLTFQIIVSNLSLETVAQGGVLVDVLPQGFTFQSAAGASCDSSIRCNLGELGAGASITIQIIVLANQTGLWSNSVSVNVTGSQLDSNPTNNMATVDVQVNEAPPIPPTPLPPPVQADLSVVLAGSPYADLGNTVTLTATIQNNGLDQANNILLSGILPAGMTLQSIQTPQGTCVEGAIQCSLGSLNKDGVLLVQIMASAGQAGPVAATVNVSGNEADPNPGNNASSFSFTVNPPDHINHPPIAVDDYVEAKNHQREPIVIDVIANDSDPDGDALVVFEKGGQLHGMIEIRDNRILYLPFWDYQGTDSFWYKIDDGYGGTGSAHVYVTVKSGQ